MKPDQKVVVIFFLSSILIGIAAAYFLPRFINTQKPFIDKAEIVRYTSVPGPSDSTEEYHLWLRLELSPDTFDALFRNNKDDSPKDAPAVKKDEMRTERLVTASVIQDMLIIKGYINEGAITNTGLLLRINKAITLAKENLRPLENEEPLANPQGVSRQIFLPQTDIYQTIEGDKTLLYIHLESGIKPRNTPNLLSLTLIYLKDNKATQSQTLPPFRY
jgi:hypothetical protein